MKMEKDLNQTQETLIQITEAFKRTRQMLARRRTGDYLILWGVLISLGYALSQFFKGKESLNWFWLSLAGIGWVGTILITIRQIKMTKGKSLFSRRYVYRHCLDFAGDLFVDLVFHYQQRKRWIEWNWCFSFMVEFYDVRLHFDGNFSREGNGFFGNFRDAIVNNLWFISS
jgi:hypothetical protein